MLNHSLCFIPSVECYRQPIYVDVAGEVRFYIIMVGLNVLLRNVHAETRVCSPEMSIFSHTNRAMCFYCADYVIVAEF